MMHERNFLPGDPGPDTDKPRHLWIDFLLVLFGVAIVIGFALAGITMYESE